MNDMNAGSLRRPLLALAMLVVLAAPACRKESVVSAEQKAEVQQFVVEPANGKKLQIVAYGDVRFTNPSRTDASNPEIRRAIVAKIAEEKPDFVVFTGDLVLAGDRDHDWEVYRQESQPWRDAKIRLFTLPGNHDEYGDPKLAHYFKEFRELDYDRWYTIRAANTLTLMLDSDVDAQGGPEWQWVEKTLDSVPQDVDF